MTVQEAKIKQVKITKQILDNMLSCTKGVNAFFEVLSESLERQVPKPVGFERIKEDVCTCTNQIAKAGTSLFKCPVCNEYIECRTYKFCNRCGQALDWSE